MSLKTFGASFALVSMLVSPLISVGSANALTPTCAATVTSRAQITSACNDKVLALIKNAGYFNTEAYQQANGLTNYSQQTATVGPFTYNHAMHGDKLHITSTDYSRHVMVDLSEQLGTLFINGHAALISRVSTGSGNSYTYTDKNGIVQHSTAITPLGTSRIYAKHDQYYRSQDLGGPIGSMAWDLAFNGGIGLHTGVLPGYPASHGCVRFDTGSTATQMDDAVKIMRDKGLTIGDKVTVQK